MNIEDFLHQNIEEYLFKDLNNISNITVPEGEVGEGSYPMLATILAGIELLGTIITNGKAVDNVSGKNKIDGEKHFKHYWLNYLSEQDIKYKGFEKLFYDLLRNGIVHTFMVKQNIVVFKNKKDHMIYTKVPPLLVVGCAQFFSDFKASYFKYIRPIPSGGKTTTGVDRNKMQSNLDDLLNLYSTESESQFAVLNTSPVKMVTSINELAKCSGASISPVDMRELIDAGGTTNPSGIDIFRKKSK